MPGVPRDLSGEIVGLDYFGARYFSAAQGRFTSPDWSETPQPVPYADLADPQTLNLYSYVRNNPLSNVDADGHCTTVLTCTITISTTAGPRLAAVGAAGATAVVAFGALAYKVITYRGEGDFVGGGRFGIASEGGATQMMMQQDQQAAQNQGQQGQTSQGQGQSTPADPNQSGQGIRQVQTTTDCRYDRTRRL